LPNPALPRELVSNPECTFSLWTLVFLGEQPTVNIGFRLTQQFIFAHFWTRTESCCWKKVTEVALLQNSYFETSVLLTLMVMSNMNNIITVPTK